MKRWRLMLMPVQKHKKRRIRAGERRRLAAAWRRAYVSFAASFLIGGLFIYLATTTPRIGSPKEMVRAQLTRGASFRSVKREDALPGASSRINPMPGQTSRSNTTNIVTQVLPSQKPASANIGFEQLGAFPINVTQLMFQSTNSSERSSEVDEQIPESIRKCDGQTVSVKGFMLPLKFDNGLVTQFLLLKSQALCCYGALPRINEWIIVDTAKGTRPAMDRPVTIRGRLRVGEIREDGLLTGIYRMEAE